MSRFARIVATGRHLPTERVSNADLLERLGEAHAGRLARFESGSGIHARYRAAPGEATSDLAAAAARQALARADLAPTDVDMILVGTDTPDFPTPATSTVLQAKLGAHQAGTFDIGCACASFPTALATAQGLIATNTGVDTVLVVGAYLMSRHTADDDPMGFFYGDGAGAAVVTAGDRPGVLGAAFEADGRYADYWGIDAGGTVEPASAAAVAAGRHRVRVKHRYPPEVNETGWPRLVRRLVARCGLAVADIDHVIFTQINRCTIEHACAALGLTPERAVMIMGECGYTGSACVPMALDHLLGSGRAAAGDRVVLLGSGVGYNMAAVALEIGSDALRANPG
ncbi:3-oxoacyl-ACP synthase III family protein [Arhodomonas sp. KWT2]|uniref:3-oxoacyl-ACP synthase III family protein n=1 Tax=unclassified Arhodomonas TaxID=2621637 RepID=UPI0013D80413|nr:ketoacyl-ACP synthase III [Arhodomonas sp. KWT]